MSLTRVTLDGGPTPAENAAFSTAMQAFYKAITDYHQTTVHHLVISFNPGSEGADPTYHVATNIASEHLPRVLDLLKESFKTFEVVIAQHESRGETKQ